MSEENLEIKDNTKTSKIPLTGVLEILANKVSRKATIIAMAMILIYMLAATPNVVNILLFVGSIGGLAVFFTLLQYFSDTKESKKNKAREA